MAGGRWKPRVRILIASQPWVFYNPHFLLLGFTLFSCISELVFLPCHLSDHSFIPRYLWALSRSAWIMSVNTTVTVPHQRRLKPCGCWGQCGQCLLQVGDSMGGVSAGLCPEPRAWRSGTRVWSLEATAAPGVTQGGASLPRGLSCPSEKWGAPLVQVFTSPVGCRCSEFVQEPLPVPAGQGSPRLWPLVTHYMTKVPNSK